MQDHRPGRLSVVVAVDLQIASARPQGDVTHLVHSFALANVVDQGAGHGPDRGLAPLELGSQAIHRALTIRPVVTLLASEDAGILV